MTRGQRQIAGEIAELLGPSEGPFAVAAYRSGERFYLTSTTTLQYRTMLHLSLSPRAHGRRAAADLIKLAQQDEQLSRIEVEVLA